MLKGEVTIQLKDVNTGEVEEYKEHNTVTNAIDEFFSYLPLFYGRNMVTNPIDVFLPIATQALGGLILFSESMSTSGTQICIPTDKKILAFAADDADNVSACRGTYNTLESGPTQTGYRSVWDFSTSQANGTIVTVGRTFLTTGKNLYSNTVVEGSSTAINRRAGDDFQTVFLYRDNYIYYLRPTSPVSKSVVLCRMYEPCVLKVSDSIWGAGEEEVISTFETSASTNISSIPYVHNGCDGYAYATIDSSANFKYLKIDLVNLTITEHTISIISGGYYPLFHKGHLYKLPNTQDVVYIYDLSDSSYVTCTLPHTTPGGIKRASNGSIVVDLRTSNQPNYGPYGIIYEDGSLLYVEKEVPSTLYALEPICTYDENDTLLYRTYNSNNTPQFALNTKYLGTVLTLPSPITKTANQVMKVIYTLTDATE